MWVLPVITPYLVWSQWEPGSHRHTRSLLMRPQFSNARSLPTSFRQWWVGHRVQASCELPHWTSGPEWTAAADSQHWAADEKFNIFLVGTFVLENSLELPEFYSENFTAAICVCANSWCGKGSSTPSVLGLLLDQDTVLCCPWKQPGLALRAWVQPAAEGSAHTATSGEELPPVKAYFRISPRKHPNSPQTIASSEIRLVPLAWHFLKISQYKTLPSLSQTQCPDICFSPHMVKKDCWLSKVFYEI